MSNFLSSRRSFIYGCKLILCYVCVVLFLLLPSRWGHIRIAHAAAQSAFKIQTHLKKTPPKPVSVVLGNPISIFFVRQNRTIPITPGYYNQIQNTWNVTFNDVEWIKVNTQLENDQPTAPSVLYGHNSEQVLAPVQQSIANDIVILTYFQGTKVAYKYQSDQIITPTNLAVLSITDPHYLGVFTCSGNNNQFRHLINYSFIGITQ